MSEHVSDFFVSRLKAWGVRRIFGYTGDGINGILGALDRAGNDPALIQVRHEEMAALMACAHAKFTGEVGVCLATQGPGAIHLLNGLYDAKLDHQPVVAIVGQQSSMAVGSNYQQDVDLSTLFKDVASAYVETISSPAQARHVIDRAFRIAKAERTVTCIIVPHDVQDQEAVPNPPEQHGAQHSGTAFSYPRILPTDADLKRAAEILNAGQKVAMLVGAGALHATDAIIEVAELLGAGVAKALLGKAAAPDDLPFVTGSVGWLGTSASNEMMMECDTLLMVGSGFPYTEYLPKEGQARGVQIDIDGTMLNLRYPMEASLCGDSAETLRALIPLLTRKTDRAWRQQIEQKIQQSRQSLEQRAMHDANPLNPQRVFWELSPRLPANSILTADSGTSTVWYARDLQIQRGMMASVSGNLATMGCAIPYAIAAKFAHPERAVIACVGDGAMQMSGINELITIAKEWKRWSDPRLIVLVLNNRDLNYVTWEQRVMEGNRRFAESQAVPDFPYARYAELIGLQGIRIDAPDQVAGAWERALTANMPVVIEAYVDPDVPTIPPQMKPEQVQKLAAALANDDPERAGVLRQIEQEQPELAKQLRSAN
ncbi:MAG: thiamine pyrophosphate-requiring protein [Chloroflexota bacterium]|nr:thiamine pyrophosphate-requiring protein [Chloroflexota bacterium]